MTMSSVRLLEGLQSILQGIKDAYPEKITQAELMVGELMKREDFEVSRRHYEAGRNLLAAVLENRPGQSGNGPFAALSQQLAELPAALSPEWSWQKRADVLSRLMQLVMDYGAFAIQEGAGPDGLSNFLSWEVEGFEITPALAVAAASSPVGAITANDVAAALRAGLAGYEDVVIDDFVQIVGGVSKSTFSFSATTEKYGVEPLVVRGESLLPILDQVYWGMDLVKEFHLLRYLFRSGAPVAEPLLLASGDTGCRQRFFISRRMPGKPPGDYLMRFDNLSPDLTDDIARALASVHNLAVDLRDTDLVKSHIVTAGATTRTQAVKEFIERSHAYWSRSGAQPSAMVEVTTQWLLANVPESDLPPCIVHRDAGLNNILVHNGCVSAIIDWESSDLGDPVEDLVWLPYLTGGAIDQERLLASYVLAGGFRPTEFELAYFGVLARYRIIVAAMDMQLKYESTPGANTILCAAGLGQIPKISTDLGPSIARAMAEKERIRQSR